MSYSSGRDLNNYNPAHRETIAKGIVDNFTSNVIRGAKGVGAIARNLIVPNLAHAEVGNPDLQDWGYGTSNPPQVVGKPITGASSYKKYQFVTPGGVGYRVSQVGAVYLGNPVGGPPDDKNGFYYDKKVADIGFSVADVDNLKNGTTYAQARTDAINDFKKRSESGYFDYYMAQGI